MRRAFHQPLLLTLLPLLGGCQRDGQAAADKDEAQAVAVEVERLAPRQVRPSVKVVADVLPWRQVTVAAEAAGRVRALGADTGQRVKAGQVLARLDASKSVHNLDLVGAQREQAQARLDEASRDLSRVKALTSRGVAAKAQLDRAESAVRLARAQLRAAMAQKALTRRRVADSRVLAPFASTVARRQVELGDYVVPGRPVMTLVDLSRVKVRAGLALAEALAVKPGQRCEVRVGVIGGAPLVGEIKTVGALADPRTRRVEIEAAIDNADGKLKPGMIAEVTFWLGKPAKRLLIPTAAVVELFDVPYAFVVDQRAAPAKATKRPVAHRRQLTLGRRYGADVVVARGLVAGERLVVVGQEGLADGTPLRIVAPPPPSKKQPPPPKKQPPTSKKQPGGR